jgi:holo-[acyl-carrier protein] synthase
MITGVGIDMIETERIEAKIAKESGFRELVFSKKEIDYCETKAHKFEHYAARFAAKEAFLKALGTGWKNGTAFNEIEITNEESGKPEIVLFGETAKTIKTMAIGKISVSLSHLKGIAAAVVIIETSSRPSP